MTKLAFVDLDGVLADFVRGALKHHKKDKKLAYADIRWDLVEQFGMGASDFWNPLGFKFWQGLSPTEEIHDILQIICGRFGAENTFLLSSPCMTKGCTQGKASWVEKHLPDYSRRLLLTNRKEVFAGKYRFLFDDHDKNCFGWVQAGGSGACLVPRPWNDNRGKDVVKFVKDFLEAHV